MRCEYMTKDEQLDALEEEVAQAELPLEADAKNLVFGRGSGDADIFIIGEAPGADEDEQGLPFVGRSGKVLSEALKTAGLNEERDVYIANIVKYRPPNNRDPYVAEVKAHTPWLLKQIAIVSPEVLVPLGNTATKFFLGNTYDSLGSVRGKMHEAGIEQVSVPVFPTYHPAATLYNRSLRPVFVEDLEELKQG